LYITTCIENYLSGSFRLSQIMVSGSLKLTFNLLTVQLVIRVAYASAEMLDDVIFRN